MSLPGPQIISQSDGSPTVLHVVLPIPFLYSIPYTVLTFNSLFAAEATVHDHIL